VFWFTLVFLVLIRISFGFIFSHGFKTAVTSQLLDKSQTLGRAEVVNIGFFFEKFGNSVANTAQLDSVINHRAAVAHDLEVFINQNKRFDYVAGIVLTNEQGIVEFNSNTLGTKDKGINLADRDFFIWAKNKAKTGEYFISEPVISRLGASEGETVVLVASPVYQDNVFSGVVASSVRLHPFLERFINHMKISDSMQTHLIDREGKLLHSSFGSDIVGTDILDYLSDNHEMIAKLKSVLSATEEGYFKTEKEMVTYSPIELGSQNWLLILSSSMEEIEKLEKPFFMSQIALTAVASLTFLVVIILLMKGNRV
jgi:hypothetical protein